MNNNILIQNNNINLKFYNPNLENKSIPISNQKKKNSLKIDFPSPPLIGLQNVGASYYMNATLQCLSQIGKLTNYYFKYSERVKEIMKNYKTNNTLYLTYKYLIENLWLSNHEYISTKE